MVRKSKIIKGNIYYLCKRCGEYKLKDEWYLGNNGKTTSYCKQCMKERVKGIDRREYNKGYRREGKGAIVYKVDRYLYRYDKNFLQSKKTFEELGEWSKIRRDYKKNYIIFNVPENIITIEEKMFLFGMNKEEYTKYVRTRKDSIS